MGRRLGQLTGALAVALVIGRLGRLLQSSPDMVQWQLILVASVFLGGVIWWLLSQLSLNRWVKLGLFALGAVILVLRISVPLTLVVGFIPSAGTLPALVAELDEAIRNIRFGVPPVLPEEGLTAILAVLMWVTGGLYAWGATSGPVAAMTLPSIVLYLQFAVFDRVQAGLEWMIGSTAVLALAIVSVALDRDTESGRARDTDGRPIPRRSTTTALVTAGLVGVVAIGAATTASGLVSEYGNLPWRSSGSGFGGEGGRVQFEPFVDLRQRLISRSNALLFQATLSQDAPPPNNVYWRMFTLDTFDGVEWERSSGRIANYEEGQGVGADHHRYQGSNRDFLARVRIEALAQDIAPTPGVATEVHEFNDDGAIDPLSFQVTQDSSLFYPPTFREGDQYQVRAVYPDQEADFDLLATDEDGELSSLFASATEAGELILQADDTETSIDQPPDLEFYTQLPEDEIPPSIRGIAALRTRGAETPFEQAWMLQHWFRDSGNFTYSTEVTTGHDALVLDEWLTEEDSPNYRTGYCEQFATSMAVLGRALGIPSRVVLGFTPGTVTDSGVIQVRDTNAHAWVEMWMPEVGWTTFDPTPRGQFQPASFTASFDPQAYVPEGQQNSPQEGLLDPTLQSDDSVGITDIPPADSLGSGTTWWLWILPVLVVVALVPPIAKWVRRRRRLARVREGDITAIWDEIVDRLTDLGEPIPASLTPIEFARETDDALLRLAVEYSASVYGGRASVATETDLLQVEGWLERRYDTSRRVRAALSLRSFLEDDRGSGS